MRILVFGAGVLGCNLARDFYRSKKDVTLLARGKWADEIKNNGLRIKSQIFPHTSVTHIPVITELKANDIYDVIFVAIRYTQIDSIIDILNQNQSKNIVFVGNNTNTNETSLLLKNKNVMFAFSVSAGYRESNRVVSVDLKKITIGQLANAPSNEEFIKQIFAGTKYKVKYEPNMGDYLLCHAAFVVPVAFACYKTDGKLKKIKRNKAYLNKMIDANIEGYRAIKNAGHEILPDDDKKFEGKKYRKTCLRFFKLMCATVLGKICASDHAMNAIDEMSALNNDLKKFFEEYGADYSIWKELENECTKYLK